MIAEKIMWHVICDGCGADAQAFRLTVAWEDRATARSATGWWTDNAERDLCRVCAHLCPDCAP